MAVRHKLYFCHRSWFWFRNADINSYPVGTAFRCLEAQRAEHQGHSGHAACSLGL